MKSRFELLYYTTLKFSCLWERIFFLWKIQNF